MCILCRFIHNRRCHLFWWTDEGLQSVFVALNHRNSVKAPESLHDHVGAVPSRTRFLPPETPENDHFKLLRRRSSTVPMSDSETLHNGTPELSGDSWSGPHNELQHESPLSGVARCVLSIALPVRDSLQNLYSPLVHLQCNFRSVLVDHCLFHVISMYFSI